MKNNARAEGVTEGMVSTASSIAVSSQSPFSSIDLDWHNSPEGKGLLAHLMEPNSSIRKNYGMKCSTTVPLLYIYSGYPLKHFRQIY